ncbi:hypothetical protein N7540_004704 [Penicillium herquei]|nr:hypothetical protein N7540_004704 [Penicillium herquei]
MASYDDRNRAFLQAFMGRSSMTFEEAQPVLAAILSAYEGRNVSVDDITEEHLSSYISAANTAVSPFDLEIRSSFHQISRQSDQENTNNQPIRVYALVNTTSDPLTQLATTYSADEIAFVKRVLDYMFVTNNTRICEGMIISSMQAINIRSAADANRRRSSNLGTQGGAAQSLTMTQAENMMKRLVEEGWLERSRKDNFSLSPRALMELRGWLVAEYNEDPESRRNRIKFCAACKDIITVGQRCGDRECSGRLHTHCLRNFFRIHRAEKCPTCKADWPGDVFVGERAVLAANSRRETTNEPRRAAPPSSAVDRDASSSAEPASSAGGSESAEDEEG